MSKHSRRSDLSIALSEALEQNEELHDALTRLKAVCKDHLLPKCREAGGELPIADSLHIEQTFADVDAALSRREAAGWGGQTDE